jgi:hypothetical protein
MICSIDFEQCIGVRDSSSIDMLPALGLTALVLVAIAIAYEFRELIGALLVVLVGAGFLWSAGLLQVLFVISFITPILYFTIIPADDNWKGWRRWHPGIWLAAPCFIAAIAMAIWAHDETKTAATITNMLGTVLLLWGWLNYALRTEERERHQRTPDERAKRQ